MAAPPSEDPNSALFRIEVIKVPLAHPEQAAIVSSPRIFNDLVAPPKHGETPRGHRRRASGWPTRRARRAASSAKIDSQEIVPRPTISPSELLASVVAARGGTGAPTAADSATLREPLQAIVDSLVGTPLKDASGQLPGPTQCHDITRLSRRSAWPAARAAATGCCSTSATRRTPSASAPCPTPTSPTGTRPRSTTTAPRSCSRDEWGGGGQPKCRTTDKPEWGADAIFTLADRKMQFQSYYKMPAPQTAQENCVAHNGSLIPIPGRDVMVQAWYQGGISVFDWTDAAHPKEIAFFDRGPVDSTRLASGGSWSVYWYNGVMVSSEIARGLDIFELDAERVHLAERDRRGQDGPAGLPQHPGPAEAGLAGELRARAGVRRPARAVARGSSRGGSPATRKALDGAEHATARRGRTRSRRWPPSSTVERGRAGRRGEGEAAGGRGAGAGGGGELGGRSGGRIRGRRRTRECVAVLVCKRLRGVGEVWLGLIVDKSKY